MSHLLVFRVGIVECKDRRSNATAIVSFRRDVEFNAWGSSESVGGLLNQNICMSRKQVVGALNLARYIYHRCSVSQSLVSEETRVSPDISTGYVNAGRDPRLTAARVVTLCKYPVYIRQSRVVVFVDM